MRREDVIEGYRNIDTSREPWALAGRYSHHRPALDAEVVIEALPRRAGQPAAMRRYQEGYERYMSLLPVLGSEASEVDFYLQEKTMVAA